MPRPLSLIAPAALACAAAVAAHAAARTPERGAPLPGLWRYDTSFLFSSDSDTRCIGPADIDKILQGPSNKHYDCTYPVREVAGGRARFEGVCVNRKHGQKAQVSLQGAYGPDSFEFHGVVKPDLGGLSLPLDASISAKRVSTTCPAA